MNVVCCSFDWVLRVKNLTFSCIHDKISFSFEQPSPNHTCILCNYMKIDLKMNGTLSAKATLSVLPHFSTLGSNAILQDLCYPEKHVFVIQESKQEVPKVVPLGKIGRKHGGVPSGWNQLNFHDRTPEGVSDQ